MLPAPGLYTCMKLWKKLYKIRLQKDFFQTCNKWVKLYGLSVDIKILSPEGCLPLSQGRIHVLNHEKKCIKSDFKVMFLKLATNDRSDKMFLLTTEFHPQGVISPCPGAIYMFKPWKKMYKIRLQRDLFETCSKWQKWQDIKILSHGVVCPWFVAIYIYEIMKRCVWSQRLKRFFLNFHQMTIPVDIKILALIGCLPLPKGYV